MRIEFKRKLVAAFERRFGKANFSVLSFGSDDHQLWVSDKATGKFLSGKILDNGRLRVIAAFEKALGPSISVEPIAAPAIARALLSGSSINGSPVYVGDKLSRPAPFNPAMLGVDLSEPDHVRFADSALVTVDYAGVEARILSRLNIPKKFGKRTPRQKAIDFALMYGITPADRRNNGL